MLEEDEGLLRRRARECRDPNEKIRYLALHSLSMGTPITEAARLFIVDRSAVYEWTIQWKHKKTLSDEPREGRGVSIRTQ